MHEVKKASYNSQQPDKTTDSIPAAPQYKRSPHNRCKVLRCNAIFTRLLRVFQEGRGAWIT